MVHLASGRTGMALTKPLQTFETLRGTPGSAMAVKRSLCFLRLIVGPYFLSASTDCRSATPPTNPRRARATLPWPLPDHAPATAPTRSAVFSSVTGGAPVVAAAAAAADTAKVAAGLTSADTMAAVAPAAAIPTAAVATVLMGTTGGMASVASKAARRQVIVHSTPVGKAGKARA